MREGYKKVRTQRHNGFLPSSTHSWNISGYMLQFYGTLFKISMLDGWLVVFTGPKLIDELRRASDDELSAVEGTTQVRPGPPFRFSRREIHMPSIIHSPTLPSTSNHTPYRNSFG